MEKFQTTTLAYNSAPLSTTFCAVFIAGWLLPCYSAEAELYESVRLPKKDEWENCLEIRKLD